MVGVSDRLQESSPEAVLQLLNQLKREEEAITDDMVEQLHSKQVRGCTRNSLCFEVGDYCYSWWRPTLFPNLWSSGSGTIE